MNDENAALAILQYSIREDGEIYIDIQLDDYSDFTLNKFALLLASLSNTGFQLQTLQVAQEGFVKDGKTVELQKLISQILLNEKSFSNTKESDEGEDYKKDDPLIKPTDLM
jgi:hypothetical protein